VTSTRRNQSRGNHPDSAGVDQLVTAVLTASRVLVAVSARSLARLEETVTLAQFRMLVVLESRPDSNLNGLADELGVNSSTAMRMIDRLLSSELVTRRDNPANRREVLLALTPAGRRLVDRVTKRRRNEIAKIVTAMPERERAQLVDALHSFATAAGEPSAGDRVSALGW
jgi:DNA-binding MarR family transcriptional regulator